MLTNKLSVKIWNTLLLAFLSASFLSCASVSEFVVDPKASLESSIDSALKFGCTKVFEDLNETANWYSNYGETSVANARGLKKKVDYLLEIDGGSLEESVPNPNEFNLNIANFRRRYNQYLTEISVPLSGGKVARCSETEYCYEVTYGLLQKQYNSLESQIGLVRSADSNSIFENPLSILYKHYIGSAKGQCKKSIMSALSIELQEVNKLKY